MTLPEPKYLFIKIYRFQDNSLYIPETSDLAQTMQEALQGWDEAWGSSLYQVMRVNMSDMTIEDVSEEFADYIIQEGGDFVPEICERLDRHANDYYEPRQKPILGIPYGGKP